MKYGKMPIAALTLSSALFMLGMTCRPVPRPDYFSVRAANGAAGAGQDKKKELEYFLALGGKRIKMPAAYAENCARCHDADGCGRGIDVYDNSAERFTGTMRPADLRLPAYSQADDSRQRVYSAIENGVGDMPAFPGITEKEKKEIFRFVRELGRINAEELHRMPAQKNR